MRIISSGSRAELIRIICRAVTEYEKSGIYTNDNLLICTEEAIPDDCTIETLCALSDLNDNYGIDDKNASEDLKDFAVNRLYDYLFDYDIVEHAPEGWEED